MPDLSWPAIAIMALVPLPLGVLLASPFWRTHQMILGNLAGSAVVFLIAVVLMRQEQAVLDRMTQQCLAASVTCWPEPPAFIRFAIFACIGLLEVFALFLISLRVEHRAARQRYAPEWR